MIIIIQLHLYELYNRARFYCGSILIHEMGYDLRPVTLPRTVCCVGCTHDRSHKQFGSRFEIRRWVPVDDDDLKSYMMLAIGPRWTSVRIIRASKSKFGNSPYVALFIMTVLSTMWWQCQSEPVHSGSGLLYNNEDLEDGNVFRPYGWFE